MEPKKDNIIQRIKTERGFADEIYKKYRNERYGIGSCCGDNLPSYIKDKYLCDYQDNTVTQYESIKVSKTTYTPPANVLPEDDPNRPAWVDKLCGMSQADVDVYFYYDTTSLGVQQVQDAYYAANEWVKEIKEEAQKKKDNDSCAGKGDGRDIIINEYHTVVQGERWLDWAISPMTGVFNNSGSCGGNGTVTVTGGTCSTGTAVNVDPNPSRNYGTNDCGSAADATFISNVKATTKFWLILQWAQSQNIPFYNAGPAGYDVPMSVAPVANGGNGGVDNSGGAFAGVVTIGTAPVASTKNLLVVCFIDESASASYKQPYHDNAAGLNPTWNDATDGTGTVTPCWAADHTEFVAQRAAWMAGETGRQSDFFVYPSAPSNVKPQHRSFPLHALGAVTSGDKTPADGTLTVAPFNTLVSLAPITTSNPYFAQGYGALDQHGWGINTFEGIFDKDIFKQDLSLFVDLEECNDSECFLFVVKDQNGNPVSCHPITINGGVIGETDENGLLRWCVRNASVNTQHVLDLCTCLTTTGGCKSQKVAITITDKCKFTACDTTPFQACELPAETPSSGNVQKGCTDPLADNYDPNATVDDGSCTYCKQFNIALETLTDATETGGTCNDDGAIDISVNGGTSPYIYSWVGPGGFTATTQDITGLCGGAYTVTVSDSATNPCTASRTFYLSQDPTIVWGCTDATACNYDATANNDDGSCLYSGCTDSGATDYDPTATADCNCNAQGTSTYQNQSGWDSCCTPCVYGCTDPNANNHNAAATCDDGSCTYDWKCVQQGQPATNSCVDLGYTFVGTFSSFTSYMDFISNPSNSLTNIPLNTLYFSATWLAPGPNNCVDNNGNAQKITTMVMVELIDPAGDCGQKWPSSWTTFLATSIGPNGGSTNNMHKFTGGSWQDVIDAFNSTIADGQTWRNSSGTVITTFTGIDYSTLLDIVYASQGTLNSSNTTAIVDEVVAECPHSTFEITLGAGSCNCTGTGQECNCMEMLDGTGIHPDKATCEADPSNCCDVESNNYICIPGTITDSCWQKARASNNIISTTPSLNENLANEWTITHPGATLLDAYWFEVAGGGGNCELLLGMSKWFIRKITVTNTQSDTLAPESWYLDGNGGQDPSGGTGISWSTIQTALHNAGYDGNTYPDLSSADWMYARLITSQNQPGVWTFDCDIAMCTCLSQGGCDCVVDESGTFTDYSTCLATCCPQTSFGCTDPNSFNYHIGATIDDGSCIDCNNSTPVYNSAPTTNMTISNITAPTSNSSNDGSALLTLQASIYSNMVVNVWVYDSTNTIVYNTAIPSTAVTTTISGLTNDHYTVVANMQYIYAPFGVLCPNTVTFTCGTVGELLWECTTTQALTTTPDLSSTPYLNMNVAQLPTATTTTGAYTNADAALDDWSISAYKAYPMSMHTPWWFDVVGYPNPGGCKNTFLNADKKYLVKIEVYDATSGGNVVYTMDNQGPVSWEDVQSFVSGYIGNTAAETANVSTMKTLLTAASKRLEVSSVQVLCGGGCDCQQTMTGTHSSRTACENNCCLAGCTDPSADNYNQTATYDDGSCIYCSDFQAFINLVQPSIPTGNSGNWSSSNTNVGNGSITASATGGSGVYNVEVRYSGYNNNIVTNTNSYYWGLWPGYYEVKVTDSVLGCTDVIYTQLGQLTNKCHNSGTPWLPNSDSNFTNTAGQHNFLRITNQLTNTGNYQIYPLTSTSWKIDNLAPGNYTITVWKDDGTLLQTASAVTSLTMTTQTTGSKYSIEIYKENGSNCDRIGAVYEFDPI